MNETLNINLEDYDLIPVLGVTVNEQQHVFDIEVDTVHRFEAKNPHSGLSSISHNSARMATKYWKDRDVLEFADIKREGFLKSANNSILVDAEFWELVGNPTNRTPWAVHARRVFAAATEAAYHDNTGEPGFINVDKLTWSDEGMETVTADNYIDPYYSANVISIHRKTKEMIAYLLEKAKQKKYKVIVNPCSEIPIAVWGAYCIIGDVCGTYARTPDEFKQACVLMARALMRVNLMKSMYSAEVKRTMRIGVGMIGIFEFAWNHWQINMHEILLADLPEDHPKVLEAVAKDSQVYKRSLQFAAFIESCGRAAEASATEYAHEIGVNVPHTFLTLKPAGCMNPETRVKTSEGVVSLRELFASHGVNIDEYPNASHLWFEPTKDTFVYDQNNDLKRVTRLFINGDSQTMKLTMEDGTVVQCTPRHKVLTSNSGWVPACDLDLNDDIVQF